MLFSTAFISLGIFDCSTDLNSQYNSKCSSTVKLLNNTSYWGHIPTNLRKWFIISEDNIFLPLYIAFPPLGQINPVKILIKVVLPAPLEPNNTNISFSYKSKLISSKTILSPKLFLIFFILNTPFFLLGKGAGSFIKVFDDNTSVFISSLILLIFFGFSIL